MDGVRWLSYAEMADALGIGRESARVLARRKRWPRRPGNDGQARIGVPEEEIAARNDPPSTPPNGPPSDPPNDPPSDPRADPANEPDQLTELRVLNARLETRIEALQALIEAEKERAGRERQLLEKAVEDTAAQRDKWAAIAERLTHSQSRSWWPWRRSA